MLNSATQHGAASSRIESMSTRLALMSPLLLPVPATLLLPCATHFPKLTGTSPNSCLVPSSTATKRRGKNNLPGGKSAERELVPYFLDDKVCPTFPCPTPAQLNLSPVHTPISLGSGCPSRRTTMHDSPNIHHCSPILAEPPCLF